MNRLPAPGIFISIIFYTFVSDSKKGALQLIKLCDFQHQDLLGFYK